MDRHISDIVKRNSRKKLLKRALALCCALVLLLTVNSLKLTANTLARKPMCGLKEHVHTGDCYNEAGELVCGEIEHTHTDACYQEAPSLEDLEIDETGFDEDGLVSDDALGLDLSADLVSDDVPQAEAQGVEETPVYHLGEKARLSKIIEQTGMSVKLKKIIEVGVVDNDGTQAGLIKVTKKDKDYIIKAQQDFNEVELALVLKDGVRTIRLVDGKGPKVSENETASRDRKQTGVEEFGADNTQSDQPFDVELNEAQQQPADDAQQQPVIDEQQQPVDDAQQQPVIDEQQQPADDAQQPVIDEQQQPADDEQQPVIDEQQPVIDEQQQPADDAQQQPADDEQQPVIDEQQPVIDEQQQPADDAQQQPVIDAQQQPADDEQQQPVIDEQQQPVIDEQQQPVIDEQQQPVIDEQQPADDAQQPVEDDGDVDSAAIKETEPSADQKPSPDGEGAEQSEADEVPKDTSADDDAQQPVDDEQQQPAEDEQQQPADDEQQQPADDEQQQPADESEQPAEGDEQQQPADDEQQQPAEGDEQPAEGDEQPAEGDEQPSEDEEQSAEGEEQPAEGDEQPAEDEEQTEEGNENEEQTAFGSVDLSGEDNYPLSLRRLMSLAGMAEPAADTAGEDDIPAEGEEAAEEAADAPAPALTPAEWTVEYDAEVFDISLADDDYAVMPLVSFDSATIAVNGFELTLTNCRLEEDAPVEEAPAEETPAEETAYPAQHFEASTAEVRVVVDAPEGAFPEGTTMKVEDVEDEKTLSDIEDTVTEDFVEVTRVHAVDISFWYNDAEIEPLQPISVVMSVPEVEAQEEAVVVHVDDQGSAEVVDSQGEEQKGSTGVAVEMPATDQPAEPAQSGAAEDAEAAAPTKDMGFEAENFSVYAVVVAKQIETKYIDARGTTWNISVAYTKEANIPADATLRVSEVTSEEYLEKAAEALEAGKRVTEAYFFDIAILDASGNEIQPEAPVQVRIALAEDAEAVSEAENSLTEDSGDPAVCAMHITDTDTAVVAATESDEAVTFDAPSFSVWGVVYTVDFHYTVNGQTFDYGIPGGDCASLRALLPALGIAADDPDTEADEVDDFMAAVQDVTFSTPELVLVHKIEENTAVGALRAALGVESEYSAALTEEERAAIDGKELTAGDWALFSLKPFTSDETLTVAMDNGDSFAVAVTDAQISTRVLDAGGQAYIITLTFGPEAEIPLDAELKATEVEKGSTEWYDYFTRAMDVVGNLAMEGDNRFFDIEIWSGGEKIEPKAAVQVNIALESEILTEPDKYQVVHFDANGPVVMEAEVQRAEDSVITNVGFETGSFSVYGVIVADSNPTGVDDLDGVSFTFDHNGKYATAVIDTDKDTHQLKKTTDANLAATWQFEATGVQGQYNIFTFVGEQKKYLNLNKRDGANAHAALGDAPQAFTVSLESGKYVFSTTSEGVTYYLNEFSGGTGFAGWYQRNTNDDRMTLTFSPVVAASKQYMLITKYEGEYYIILNDGTLVKTDNTYKVPDHVKVNDPMVWQYTGNNLYHHTKETGFNDNNLASDYYYRYIDPNVERAYTDENIDTTTGHPGGHASEYFVDSRPYMDQIQINYQDHRISSRSNPSNYIGIVRDDKGGLKIAGCVNAAEAAEIYFAEMIHENDTLQLGDRYHTVNHIDISIVGNAAISVPLAYGTYYYKDGNGDIQTLVVSRENPVIVDVNQPVDITHEDIKRGNISAYTIGANGEHIPKDDVFYVSGYSGNHDTGESTNQTRIEGIFKVADLDPVPVDKYVWNDSAHRWEVSDATIRAQRLQNKIYYTVSTTKKVSFDLSYNGFTLYDSSEAANSGDADAVSTCSATVKFSASFNYFDLNNECPPLWHWGRKNDWQNGYIVYAWAWNNGWVLDEMQGSGMDFALGTIEKDKPGVLAIEITKYIIDTEGNPITPMQDVDNVFHVYRSTTAGANDVKGMDVDKYNNQEPNNYNAYVRIHDKTATVSEGGVGTVYDYDVDEGMIYIQEDTSARNLPQNLDDVDGRNWEYVKTRLETEYVWRDDGIENRRHVSKDYTDRSEAYRSLPEILGNYKDVNNVDRYNGFLEFYVYNVYKAKPINVSVKKEWKHENGSNAEAPAGARVTVTLGRYKMVQDTDNPVIGNLTIDHQLSYSEGTTASDGTYYATYKIKQGNKIVRSGYYDPAHPSQTLEGLPAGNYTFVMTESLNGFTSNTSGKSCEINIPAGGTMKVTINTTLTKTQELHLVTVHVTNSIDGTGNDNYQVKDYSFPVGSRIVVTVNRPGGAQGGFHAKVNGKDVPYPAEQVFSNVDQQLYYDLPDTAQTVNLNYWHDWGMQDFWIRSVSLAAGSGAASSGSAQGGASAPADGTLEVTTVSGGSAPALDGAAPADGTPPCDIIGMKYAPDTTWSTDADPVQVVLANGVWEDYVENLPAVDEAGHRYLYYIRHVDEQGLPDPEHTAVSIASDSKGNVLTTDGKTVLKVTNTIPDEPPKITIRKVDDNGQPLPGASFKLEKKQNNDTVEEKTIDITSPDGVYTTEGLEGEYSYTLSEMTAPDGYQVISGTVNFRVVGKTVETLGTLPEGVTFDTENYAFTVKNTPKNDGHLKIIKRWQDFYGNAASYSGTAQMKIVQLVKNKSPQRIVRVRFLFKGDQTWEKDQNGQDNHNRPGAAYQNGAYTEFAARAARGRGNATITWRWDDTTNIGTDKIVLEGPVTAGNISEIETNKKFTLTIPDNGDGKDVTVLVKVDNYNWNPWDLQEYISNISFDNSSSQGEGYTLTGGSRTITLGESGVWTREYTLGGNGLLDEGTGTVLPAQYEGRDCRYIIEEVNIPDNYSVSYSDNNSVGIGNNETGTITAYNRRNVVDVALVKVDKNNRQIKLQGGVFALRKLTTGQPGVAYQSGWTVRTATSDSNGALTFTDLPVGFYEIRETQAPPQYILEDNSGTPDDSSDDGFYFYIKVTQQGVFSIERDDQKYPTRWSVRPNDNLVAINKGGPLYVGNQMDNGALKITKVVKVNGENPVPSNAGVTNGTYEFSIVGTADTYTEGENHRLRITFANGVATSYQIDGGAVKTVATPTGNQWTVLVPDLKPGTYTVTETDSGNLKFVSAQVGSNAAGETNGVTLTVVAGDKYGEQASAQVEYTNNKYVVDIEATKTWKEWVNSENQDVSSTIDGVSVKFTLESRTTNDAEWQPVTGLSTAVNGLDSAVVTLPLEGKTGADRWKVAWTNLPRYAGDGTTQVQYRVRESEPKLSEHGIDLPNGSDGAVEDYYESKEYHSNPWAVVQHVNQLPVTQLTVTKAWKDGATTPADRVFAGAKSITFKLYQQLEKNDGETVAPSRTEYGSGTVSYSPDTQSWTSVSFTKLNKYVYDNDKNVWRRASYYVEENSSFPNVVVTYQKDDNTPVQTGSDAIISSSDSGNSHTITIINTDTPVTIKVIKIDEDTRNNATQTKLLDAGFTLKKVVNNVPEDVGSQQLTSNNGEVTFANLLAGDYIIVETHIPAGYISTADPRIYFTIDNGAVIWKDKDGKVLDPEKDHNMMVTYDKANQTFTMGNTAGSALPNTGGTGTTLFYAAGVSLLLLAALGLVLRGRKRDW